MFLYVYTGVFSLIQAQLLDEVKKLIVPYIRRADDAAPLRSSGQPFSSPRKNVLVERHDDRDELTRKLAISLPLNGGRGRDGLLETIRGVLRYSVNTWDQGFLDKLYSSTNPV
jgi:glutamate decarboxylase